MTTPTSTVARDRDAGQATGSTSTFDRVLLPAALTVVAVMAWRLLLRGPSVAFDFQYAYWPAGHHVLLGLSPYAWTHTQIVNRVEFVYPALSAVLFAPLALIGRSAGSVLMMLLAIALVPATLRLLCVRDTRVYGVALLWLPVYGAWQTANETVFMMFGLACVWRWRERPLVAGFLTAAMLSLKPVLWPLFLWLLVTRRWRASISTLCFALALNLAAWSVIGFGQIGRYLSAVSADTKAGWRVGYGVPALLGHFGAGLTAGAVVMLALSLVLAAAVLHAAVIKRDELRALALTVALALASSPLVWSHYLVFLLVPLAVARPRLHWGWLLPVLLWCSPVGAAVHTWQALAVWAVSGTLIWVTARRRDDAGADARAWLRAPAGLLAEPATGMASR
jgi:hypothetical protein